MMIDLVMDYGLAIVLDWLIGDLCWLYHPVRIIGHLIHTIETFLRRLQAKIPSHQFSLTSPVVWERFFGIILAVLTVGITCTGIGFILKIGAAIHPILFHILNIYFLYSALATRCLADEALKVHTLLVQKNLPQARERVGMLVGRETAHLNEKEVIRAVVENYRRKYRGWSNIPSFLHNHWFLFWTRCAARFYIQSHQYLRLDGGL